MNRTNMSITIDPVLADFVKTYQETFSLSSKSEVIERALKTLRHNQLTEEYKASIRAWEADPEEASLWDETAGDGLNLDEAW